MPIEKKSSMNNKLIINISLASAVIIILISIFVLATGEGPTIELASPVNNKIDLDGNITFAYNVTDSSANVTNCSLVFDGQINQTDTTITESVIQYFSLNNVANGKYNWSINCSNDNNDEGDSEERTIDVFIDTVAPNVSLYAPANNSQDSDGNVMFNYTVIDDNWVTKCELYTNINGTWQVNQTNSFVQQDEFISFTVENIPDDTSFIWNVKCYDFALNPNYAWSEANWTLTINNSDPTLLSPIPNQTWSEDTSNTINLSNYFYDLDGDVLNYSSNDPENITVQINDTSGIATLIPETNWWGTRYIVFHASDIMQQSVSGNNITLTVESSFEKKGSADDEPQITFMSPTDKFNDKDGFMTILCNASDDFGLANISLYTNISGSWTLNQTHNVSGLSNFTTFNLTDLNEGSYQWACKVSDTDNQSTWSENRTFTVGITAELYHDIPSIMVNNINTTRSIAIGYSSFLNNTLTLGNLTMYLSNGSIYLNEIMSNSSNYEITSEDPSLIIHYKKIEVRPNEIFYGNFTVGNEEWINISIKYYYQNNSYQISANHSIEIKSLFPTE